MKRQRTHELAILAGAASLGLVGCSHPSQPAAPSVAAAHLEPPFDEARVEPRFRSALAEYHAAVREAELVGAAPNAMAIRRAVRLLAEALRVVPYAGLHAREAASELDWSEAQTALAAPLVESSVLARALQRSELALTELAQGPYAPAPDVASHAAELRSAVQRIEPGRSLDRQRGLVLDALARADRTMQAMAQALGRGRVSPP